MKPYLIVYYSGTGVTAQVAEALARACDADLERIQDIRPRDGASGYLRSVWQAVRRIPAEIASPRHNPADYRCVVLGTPVWAGHMSAPMRGYVLSQRARLRRVGLFCTMGGAGGPGVLNALARLCGKTPLASLCLRQVDVLAGRHMAALAGFASELAAQASDEPALPLGQAPGHAADGRVI